MYRDYHPHLPDQSSIIHTCTQEQTNGHSFIYPARFCLHLLSPSLFLPSLDLNASPSVTLFIIFFSLPAVSSSRHCAISLSFPSPSRLWLLCLVWIIKSNSQQLNFVVIALLSRMLLSIGDELDKAFFFM